MVAGALLLSYGPCSPGCVCAGALLRGHRIRRLIERNHRQRQRVGWAGLQRPIASHWWDPLVWIECRKRLSWGREFSLMKWMWENVGLSSLGCTRALLGCGCARTRGGSTWLGRG